MSGNIHLRPAFCKLPECKAFYRKTEIENRRDRICVEVVAVEAHDCIERLEIAGHHVIRNICSALRLDRHKPDARELRKAGVRHGFAHAHLLCQLPLRRQTLANPQFPRQDHVRQTPHKQFTHRRRNDLPKIMYRVSSVEIGRTKTNFIVPYSSLPEYS